MSELLLSASGKCHLGEKKKKKKLCYLDSNNNLMQSIKPQYNFMFQTKFATHWSSIVNYDTLKEINSEIRIR